MANITNTFIANLKSDALTYTGTQMTDVAFGSGTTAPDSSDTTLEGEFARVTASNVTVGATKVTSSGFLGAGAGAGNTIARVGTFNSGTGGDMATQFALTSTIVKTTDKEVWVDQDMTLTVTEQ
jgi:hypothetical protein